MKNIFLNSNNLTIGYGNEIVIKNLSLSLNDEKNYEINLAVAGFNENEIEVVSMQNILYITGKKNQNNIQNIIHKGIALRPFEKKFNLDPLMEVTEAILSQGMLNIKLFKRDPEIIKPKKIEIKTT